MNTTFEATNSKSRVLIVDDNSRFARSAQLFLEQTANYCWLLRMWCSLVSPPTSSMRRGGAGWFADFLEQKSERRTNQADQDTETESVDIAEERTLLLEHAVKNSERFLRRCPVAGVARKRALEVRELLLKVEVERRHVRNKVGLARLRLTRDQRGDRRNAVAPSDVAHQIKNASSVAHLFAAERSHGPVATGTYMDDAPTPL